MRISALVLSLVKTLKPQASCLLMENMVLFCLSVGGEKDTKIPYIWSRTWIQLMMPIGSIPSDSGLKLSSLTKKAEALISIEAIFQTQHDCLA